VKTPPLKLAIEIWPVSKPQPYGKNPRKPSDRAVAKVAASLKEFGWRQPIVVDKDGVIVAGHKRREVAISLGLTEVPVHVAKDLTEAQAKAYRLMDNRSQDDSEWDEELLASEIFDLSAMDLDLKLTGFEQREINQFLAAAGESTGTGDPDQVLEPPAVPVSVPGDLWLCGGHRVLCGDSCSADAVARLLEGQKVPLLMVTDPPYGISLDSEWRDRAGLNGCGPAQPSYLKKKRTKGHTETTISGDTRADWSEAFALVPGIQVAYVWHASVFTREVLEGLLRIGFLYPQQIIWNKGRTVLTRTHYWYQHEPCWYVRKDGAAWLGGDVAGESPADIAFEGQTVLKAFHYTDQHEACVYVRKKRAPCFGLEISPQYVDVVVRRWQDISGKKAVLDGDGRAFDELAAERGKHG
jgi:hypothetical protein